MKGPITDLVRTTAIRILLENTWRIDDNDSGDDEGLTAEATTMLLVLCDTRNIRESLRLSLIRAFDDKHDPAHALTVHLDHYAPVSSELIKAVSESPSLVVSSLSLYQTVIFGLVSQVRRDALWKSIDRERHGILGSSPPRTPIVDLWRFLLQCARLAQSERNPSLLQTSDFVKLCIVLVQDDLPRILGREDPARDWLELVPVLERTADEGNLVENFPLAGLRDGTIPALARHALNRLPHLAPDIPSDLRDVLIRLAGTSSRPPATTAEGHREGRTVFQMLNPMGLRTRRPTVVERPVSRRAPSPPDVEHFVPSQAHHRPDAARQGSSQEPSPHRSLHLPLYRIARCLRRI